MCLVMFGWASGTEYWKELTESDPAKLMYQERAERKEEEGMPIGFLNQDNTYPTQDQSGDLWTPIAIDDRPEWFDDVYKNWDADWDSKF
jgi:hypothetical protein